jgi:hypothetical protein
MVASIAHLKAGPLLLFTTAFFLVLSSCSSLVAVLNGGESLIPRKAKPLEASYHVTLTYGGTATVERTLPLELYYDVQASARGNSWSVRLTGQRNDRGITFIEAEDPDLGAVSFPLNILILSFLEERKTAVFPYIVINGQKQTHIRSENSIHYYGSSQGGPPARLNYSVKVSKS